MCTIIISKLLGSVVAPWRPLLAQTTRLPCPDQQAQTQAQAQAWVRMQPPLQLRASWQPTSAVQHARSFWRPSRPWAATWTCGACRSYPCVNEAWRQSSRQEDEEDRRESERERERERGGGRGRKREREREREPAAAKKRVGKCDSRLGVRRRRLHARTLLQTLRSNNATGP